MMKSTSSRAPSAPRDDDERARVLAELDKSEQKRLSRATLVDQWLASPEAQKAGELLGDAVGARTQFVQDAELLLPPACSLPPMV